MKVKSLELMNSTIPIIFWQKGICTENIYFYNAIAFSFKQKQIMSSNEEHS